MKKKLSLIVLVLAINFCFAQEKIEKYCVAELSAGKVYMNIGKSYANFKDSAEVKTLLDLKYCKNIVDVLDYMSNKGWLLVSCLNDNGAGIICYFKKTFDKSEFSINDNIDFKNKIK